MLETVSGVDTSLYNNVFLTIDPYDLLESGVSDRKKNIKKLSQNFNNNCAGKLRDLTKNDLFYINVLLFYCKKKVCWGAGCIAVVNELNSTWTDVQGINNPEYKYINI